MRYRPLEDTVRDLMEWDKTRKEEDRKHPGLSLDEEQRLLARVGT